MATHRNEKYAKGALVTERSITYSIGDWVVHHAYGIGQIKDVEKKPIRGEQVICFRVTTNAGAEWWFPQNETDNPRIRPVASPDVMQRIQTELQQPIGDLDPDRDIWKSRINEVRASDDLIATSQIVRDLTLLKMRRRLNQTESSALSHFTERLLREWSATMNMDVIAVQKILNRYLRVYAKPASVQT
jgi:RNA polymerase-interacting CarD/CdnL/TRCF family regulator